MSNMFAKFAFVARDSTDTEDAPAPAPPSEETWTQRHAAPAFEATCAPKRAKTDAALMGAGPRAGVGAVGECTPVDVLVERWQSTLPGVVSVDARRFMTVIGCILSSQTLTGTACKAVAALRDAARADGAGDLSPEWLAGKDSADVAKIISMCNFLNNKSKFIVATARSVRHARGRVAETLDGYKLYSGVGPELAGLLKVVNTREIAEAWCDRERAKADEAWCDRERAKADEAEAPDDVVPWGLEARDGAAPPRPDDGAAPPDNAAAADAPPPPPEDDAPKKRTICL